VKRREVGIGSVTIVRLRGALWWLLWSPAAYRSEASKANTPRNFNVSLHVKRQKE